MSIGRIFCSAFHVMGFQTRAANKINTDTSSLDFLVASIHMPVFFFLSTLPRRASFNTVRLSPGSDFLLARVHTHPFFGTLGEGGGSHQWFHQQHSRAHCTHVEKRVTIAPFEFAIFFRHSACHVQNTFRRFANAGQTRDTRTRVVKHTCASLRQEITRDNLF